jgi:hypothetical protein
LGETTSRLCAKADDSPTAPAASPTETMIFFILRLDIFQPSTRLAVKKILTVDYVVNLSVGQDARQNKFQPIIYQPVTINLCS